MLSPAHHHVEVPRTLAENLIFRKALLESCRTSEANRRAVREMCKTDILFYVNAFVYQYNPKAIGEQLEVGPFITWKFQDDAIREMLWCVENRKDMVIEKSREMGASWLCLIVTEWFWHWHDWKKCLCISRDEASVDKSGDSDCLFWKLDFIHEHLPDWMMPRKWDERKHRLKLRLNNPQNRSGITGTASTGKAGVGGRAHLMFIDEFSQIDDDKEVRRRTSDTAGARIFNGTHLGLNTEFYALTQQVDMKKLVMHWTQHPEKRRGLYRYSPELKTVEVLDNDYDFPPDYKFVLDGSPTGGPFPGLRSPWYDEACSKKGSTRAVAMDLDIDPRGASNQLFDPLVIHNLIKIHAMPPFWEGDVVADSQGHVKELRQYAGGPLRMWTNFLPNGKPKVSRYGAGADISYGQGATPSVLCIGDSKTGEKVLEYANANVDETLFANLCVALCRMFADSDDSSAFFAWDMLGPAGTRFGNRVVELGFRHAYGHGEDHDFVKRYGSRPGWNGSRAAKKILVDEYSWALRQGMFINHSAAALDETLSFRWKNDGAIEHSGSVNSDDPANAGENHGDRVIADGLLWKTMKLLGAGKPPAAEVVAEEAPWGSLAWRRLERKKKEREFEEV